jgi:hypothetical protein
MTPTDLETLRAAVGPMSGTISIGNVSVSKEALTALLAEYERMREWIAGNGRHTKECERRPVMPVGTFAGCTCGLDALRATLKETEHE